MVAPRRSSFSHIFLRRQLGSGEVVPLGNRLSARMVVPALIGYFDHRVRRYPFAKCRAAWHKSSA